jgi:4'-phosphopantetheinyl transferase
MIDVYAVKLDLDSKIQPDVYEQLVKHVSPEKKERLSRFYRDEDRLRGLFADLLIRIAIQEKTGMPNEEIAFTTNDYGKPFLKDREDVQFNLSHSGAWVVGAVDMHPVGIDVEKIQQVDLGISEHYFSPDEHNDLMKKPDKIDYFFTLWSLKESYIKILGKGLSHPLNAFSMKLDGEDDIRIDVEGKPLDDVFFARYDIDKDYKMAICTSHDQLPGGVKELTPEQLIERFIPGYNGGGLQEYRN